MSVVVVSLHERDAPLELLERVAVGERELPKTLQLLADSPNLSEAVVLSTCMRTEIYAVAERFHDGVADIVALFEQLAGGSQLLEEQLEVAFDDAAARHLFEVAAGVDSAVLGEGEILRQVRHAAERARHERTLGPVLDAMFRDAVKVGKRSRTETAIARGITSLSHLAVALVVRRFGDTLHSRKVVVVGAGEMGRGILGALEHVPGNPAVVLANRSRGRALSVGQASGARVVGLSALGAELSNADVLFSATSGAGVLLDAETVSAVMAARAGRELFIVDAAVPRDIDTAVAQIEGVTLIDLADLRRYADSEMGARRGEIGLVESIIDEELERHRLSARSRAAAPLVTALRSRAEELRSSELDRVRGRLEHLAESDRELVETLTRRIVAKLLHEPTVQVKGAAGSARGERLSDALRTLFDL